jgi:hypothetical protein
VHPRLHGHMLGGERFPDTSVQGMREVATSVQVGWRPAKPASSVWNPLPAIAASQPPRCRTAACLARRPGAPSGPPHAWPSQAPPLTYALAYAPGLRP